MKKSDSNAPSEGMSTDGLKTILQRGWITNEWIDELPINPFRMHEIKNEQRTHASYFQMGTRMYTLTTRIAQPLTRGCFLVFDS